jgi:sugar transferase (PEP-CTERM system associated)
VYGAGKRASRLLELRRRSDQRGFRIIAFMPAPGDSELIRDPRVIEPKYPLIDFVKAEQIDEIVVAMDDRRTGFPLRDLLDCRFQGVRVLDLLTFLERETGKVKVDLMNPSWLIFADQFAGSPRGHVASRILDIVVAGSMAIVTLPIMALVAAAIAIEDGWPVLYRQRRVGLMGNEFTLYKFRSMYTNAEADGKARWAAAKDSRVTRVGAVIRKLRLDELPQVFNVLRGEMSLVGPRPERPEFVARLAQVIPYYHERHCVKPGITGWAQLCYPYGSSDEDAMEKLQFDLYYVKHRSLVFDLMVVIQTAEVVLWGKGAR